MYQHKIYLVVAMVLLFVALLSCKKFVDIAPPKYQVQAGELFQDDQSAISASLGLYARQSANLMFTSGSEMLYPALSADEILNTTASVNYDAFSQNSLTANNSAIFSMYSHAYLFIHHANSVIEGLEHSENLTANVKRQIQGEMKVVRALNYFYLVNLFGDVPLVTSTDYRKNASLARTPIEVVYKQVVSDLTEAQALLTADYPSVNKARPNRWTAAALLARVFLYQEKYAEAEAEASAIINSGMYALENSAGTVFTSSSRETIWQLIRDNNNTVIGSTFVPSSATARPAFVLTDYLLAAFEPGDARRMNWVGTNTVSGQAYNYPYKYKMRAASPITEYQVVFRLAEQYLIRAEARAGIGDLQGALKDLNVVRKRANLSELPLSLSANEVTLAIAQERRLELFTEGGHRWLDLKRTGKADALLSVLKAPYWKSLAALYPLPVDELEKNPALVQNPGY